MAGHHARWELSDSGNFFELYRDTAPTQDWNSMVLSILGHCWNFVCYFYLDHVLVNSATATPAWYSYNGVIYITYSMGGWPDHDKPPAVGSLRKRQH